VPQRGRSSRHASWAVLLAEDNPVNQALAVSMLDLLGCDVEVARTAGRRRGLRPDVLRSGAHGRAEPEVDGFSDRGDPQTEHARGRIDRLPIVALTATRCRRPGPVPERGHVDYLSKPFTLDACAGPRALLPAGARPRGAGCGGQARSALSAAVGGRSGNTSSASVQGRAEDLPAPAGAPLGRRTQGSPGPWFPLNVAHLVGGARLPHPVAT